MVRWRAGTRFSAVLMVTAIPVATAAIGPTFSAAAQTTSVATAFPSSTPTAHNALVPSVARAPRPSGTQQRQVAPQVTIAAGLKLRTAQERNRKIALSSSKGGPVFTASSLAEHDLPAAAMRAYKNAAHQIDASDTGCHLPWTLLAGIGRVESDHGRYGGSVLGSDGVPRPAIVGVALNGKGPVAAIRDTDNGRFDGDKVWDRAVGPMQFIPSTWRSAGRDGDHDGVANPNDIDDAALASAAYLCRGHDLSTEAGRKAAVFSYNPSDYYVDLVLAFAKGYQTGVFLIPSPPAAPASGHSAKHVKQAEPATAKKTAPRPAAKKPRTAARPAKVAVSAQPRPHTAAKPSPSPVSTPKPTPSAPKPPAPSYATVTGGLAASGGSTWTVGGKSFTVSGASAVALSDFDGDGHVESLADELNGVVARSGQVTIRFQVGSSPLKVVALSVNSLAPAPSPSASASPTTAPTG